MIISPKLHQLLMNVGMIVDDLGPRRTYTGRAGDPRSLVLNKDILHDLSMTNRFKIPIKPKTLLVILTSL